MISIKKISTASVFYRHINRFRKILQVLIKYGFGDVLKLLKIDQYFKLGFKLTHKKKDKEINRLTRPERIRKALEELGPTFIKLGQIMSTRPDLIPLEYIDELTKLQDSVPTFEYSQVRDIIKKELGKEIEEVFSQFDEVPIAAASISQVHKAKLKNGKDVVVKVQRPDIKHNVEIDLEIILRLAKIAEKNLEEFEVHQPVKTVEEFTRTLLNELNFFNEASNIQQFARHYENNSTIYVPEVYREYSTGKMLVMEYIEGIKVTNADELKNKGYNPKLIAERGANLIMDQIFDKGFFHADPHPGNVYIMKNNVICFLDYGMVGRISRKEREDFADLVMQISLRNEKKVAEALLKLTNYHGEVDKNEIERDAIELIDRHVYLPIKEMSIASLLYDLVDILTRHGLGMKPHLFLMMKALCSIDSLARSLDPEFEIVKQAEPFVKNIQMEQLSPGQLKNSLYDYTSDLLTFAKEFPAEMNALLKQTREGKLQIGFRHSGLDDFIYTQKKIANRIIFALIISSIIIGSSFIILADIPPKWYDVSALGIIGYSLAVLMGIWLIIGNIRKG